MIVDVHRHYMPKDLYESYGSLSKPTWRYNDPVLEFTFYNKLYQVDVQLRDMDEAGIDIAVLSLAQFNLKGLETCQILNNGIARVVKEHPDRFIGGYKGTAIHETGTRVNGTPGGGFVDLVAAYNAVNDPDLSTDVGWTPTLFTEIEATQRVVPAVHSGAGPFNW